MLPQAAEDLLELYVGMSKGTVPKVVQKHTKSIYLTYGKDNQEVRHFIQQLNNASSEMLKSVCLCLLSFLKFSGVSTRIRRICNFLFC